MAQRMRERNKDLPQVRLTRRGLVRLLTFARPYAWQLSLATLSTVLTSLVAVAYPALIGLIIDSAITKNVAALQTVIILLLGMAFFQAIIDFFQNYIMTTIGEKIVIDLRIRLYSHLQQLSLTFFQDHRSGELISRLSNDVMLVRVAVTNNLVSLVQNVLTLTLGLFVVIVGPNTLLSTASQFNSRIPLSTSTANFGVTTLIIALVLFPSFFLPFLVGQYVRRFSKNELTKLSEAIAASEESLSNAKIVKAFTREEYEVERFSTLAFEQYGIIRKRALLSSISQALAILFSLSGLAAFLWYSSSAVVSGALTIGTLSTIVIYFGFLSQPFISLGTLYSQFQVALGAAERIFELLDTPITIADAPDALALPPIEGTIRFEHVSFSYDRQTTVLHDLSFTIPQGKVIALVGPSGAGKTTIANLVPRFFDVSEGSITVDGHDLRSVQVKSLREQIGIVLQEPVLFGTSICENIAYGRLDATQEEIEEVARAANAHEFIQRLPQGYNTLVGERGVKLSGGQRQRISIARALLRNPRILILDEATSSLDNESESLVQEALERLMRERTTLVIAHRLSTIQNADQIIVLEQGTIKEQGTHTELLANQGVYHRLYTRSLQMS